MTTCSRCGKALSVPSSIALGMGPKCAAKALAAGDPPPPHGDDMTPPLFEDDSKA